MKAANLEASTPYLLSMLLMLLDRLLGGVQRRERGLMLGFAYLGSLVLACELLLQDQQLQLGEVECRASLSISPVWGTLSLREPHTHVQREE
jgi:hypothetical protein